MIEARPLEMEDKELRQSLIERNEQAACSYLQRVKSHLTATGLRVRILSTRAADVSTALNELIQTDTQDLALTSARGHRRANVADAPYGPIASSYIHTHS